jgi:hypothetical protein
LATLIKHSTRQNERFKRRFRLHGRIRMTACGSRPCLFY